MNAVRPVVLVTGGTGGIGSAMSRHLLDHGYDVIVHYVGNEAGASELEAYAHEHQGTCWTVQADLSSTEGIRQLVAEADSILSSSDDVRLVGLVNNAAVLLGPSFDAATPEQFDRYFALNTRAPFFLSQQISERMQPGTSIINVSSAGVHFSSSGDIIYAMSKAAVESLTFHAAEALGRRNIRINAVIPGFTDNGNPVFQDPRTRDYMGSYAVLGDVAEPRDIANVVLFLLTDRSRRITGTSLDVTGGSTLGARPPGSKLSLHDLADD